MRGKIHKLTKTVNRITAMVLIVCMLPFADYAEAFATPVNNEKTVDSISDNEAEYSISADMLDMTSPAAETSTEEQEVSQQIYESIDAERLLETKNQDSGRLIITEDYVLQQDTEVDSVYLQSGNLVLNGHKLTVNGDILQEGGNIYPNNGELIVEQDYVIAEAVFEKNEQEETVFTDQTCNGTIMMQNSGTVRVKGTFFCNSDGFVKESLIYGYFYFGGNVLLKTAMFFYDEKQKNYVPVVYLNGTGRQLLSIDDMNSLNSLYIDNKDGMIYSDRIINFNYIWGEDCDFVCGEYQVQYHNRSLESDLELDGNYLIANGTLNLNGHTLHVQGDLVQCGGTIDVNTGNIIIEGDCRFQKIYQSKEEIIYNNGMARWEMDDEKEHVLIKGDFYYQSTCSSSMYNGTLELLGDLIFDNGDKNCYFYTSNEYIVKMSGSQKQTIIWNDPTKNCFISNLVIVNISAEGVVTEGYPQITGSIRAAEGQVIHGNLSLYDYVTLYDVTIDGDVESKNVNLRGSGVITGNCILLQGMWMHGDITVQGDFIWENNSYLIFEEGKLTVLGDYRPTEETNCVTRMQMASAKDAMDVAGDFVYWSNTNTSIGKGIIRIRGDIDLQNTTYFRTVDGHKLVLLADHKQSVKLPENTDNIQVACLEIQNDSKEGVWFEQKINVNDIILNGHNLHLGTFKVTDGMELEEDTVLEEDTMLVGGEIQLNDNTLTIHDNLDINKGDLVIDEGQLSVSGNFIVENQGRLVMEKEAGRAYINGDMSVSTKKSMSGLLTDGILQLNGNFTQSGASNFIASENHKTILRLSDEIPDIEARQKIVFENAGKNYFQTIILHKDTESYYEFSPSLNGIAKEVLYADKQTDITPPSKVQGLSVTKRGSTALTLSWAPATDDVMVANYNVYRDGELVGRRVKGTNFKDKGLEEGVLYTYTVTAVDFAGNESEESEEAVGQVFPMEITEIEPGDFTTIGGKQIKIGITCQIGNSVSSVANFEYYDEEKEKWVKPERSPWYKKQLGDNTVYSYAFWKVSQENMEENIRLRFTVTDEDGNAVTRNTVCTLDTLAPEVVTNLKGEGNNGIVTLSWDKSESSDCRYYRVYRSSKQGDCYSHIGTIDSDKECVYIDKNADWGYRYLYKVYAYDKFDNCNEDVEAVNVLVTKDTLAPVITNMTPTGNRGNANRDIYVYAEDNKAIEKIEFYISKDGGSESYLGSSTVWENAQGGWTGSYTWRASSYDTGSYTISAVAVDKDYNRSEKVSRIYEIDRTAPQKVTVKESVAEYNQAYIEWNPVADDDVKYYVVEQLVDSYWSRVATLYSENNIRLNNLTPGTMYEFRVCAYDDLGNQGEYSDIISVTTTNQVEPPVIGDVSPKESVYRYLPQELEMEVTDNAGISYGTFSYSLDGKNFTQIAKVSVNKFEPSASISYKWNTKNLPEGKVIIRYGAVDIMGFSDTYNGALPMDVTYTIDRTAPAELKAPATSVSENGVDVSWTKAGEEDVVYYRLYRSDRDGKNITLIADNVTDTFCHDETAESEKVYLYYVSAVDGAGNESVLSEGTPGGALPDTEPPERVTGLAIKTRTGSAVTLTWKKSQDNYATTGYNIYRDGNLIAENVAATEYKDTGLTENTLYTYTVTALDKAGNESEESAPKDSAVFMPKITEILPKDYAVLGGESVTVTVRFENGGNSVGNHVKLEYLDPETDNWIPITETDLPQQNFDAVTLQASCPWTLPEAEEDLYLDVRATVTDADGNTDEKTVSYEIDRTAPFAPEGLKAEESAGTINLTWKPSDSPDAAGYYLYRREADETEFTKIGDISGRMTGWHTDRNVTENVTYTYRISAYDGFGREGDASALTQACAQTDTAAPQIKAVAPQAGKINRTVKITVTAYDNRGVEKVKLYIKPDDSEEWVLLSEVLTEREKNQNGQTASGGENDDTAIYEWDTTGQSGSFYVKAVAYDHAGNESRNEFLRHYTVDNEGPAKIIPEDCTATSTAVQLIWKDAEEEDFGYFVVEEKTEEGWKTKETITDRLGCTITGLVPGTSHTYRVVGYDILDNRGEPSEEITLTTTEDNINPLITRIDPVGDRFRDSIPLAMHVTDNAGVTRGRFSYTTDKETYTELAVMEADKASADRDFTYEWDISALPEKEVTVRFEAWDEAGNKNSLTEEEKEIEKTFTIDHTAPGKITGLAVTSNEGSIGLVWDEMTEEDIDHFVILRSDAEDGEYTVVENNCRTKNYYDTNVTRGHTYYYRVGAVDVAGNAGEYSDPAFATVLPDREAPTLHGISPLDGEVLGMHAGLTVLATDNAELERIIVEYRQKDGLALWNTIGTEEVTGQEGYAEIEWNTEGLRENTVYEVRAIAVDAAGNESEAVTREYTLDLTPPVMPLVTTESGSWRIGLDYGVNTDETITKYEIYRKALGEEEYTCIQSCTDTAYEDTTTETDLIYYYKVRAYDEHGNYTESMPVHDYADDTDTIPPVAELPENVMAVTGLAIALDATASTDNVRIMKYEWNFGDGKTAKGARPKHTYKEAGAYTISLTVTDAAGNSDVTTTTAIVLDGENNGITTLTVLDTQGVGIGGATVYVRTGNGENEYIKTATDSAGRVDIATKAGVYEVSAYKEGYLPADDTIRVSNYEKLESRLVLKSGEVVTGEMSVHRMELSELIEKGVDLSDPRNYNTYTFKVSLKFAQAPLPVYYEGTGNGLVQLKGKVNGLWGATGGDINIGGGGGGKTVVYATGEGSTEKHPAIYILSTTQSVSWLKDMYNVELTVMNHADTGYTITNASATLGLPKGLSLAATKSGQTMTTNFEDIEGQHSVRASWVVRGDKTGTYDISASFHGLLQPFHDPIDRTFTASQEIVVSGGNGLHIDVYPENAFYIGEKYYIQFALRNNSDRDFYNVTTTFGEYMEPDRKLEVVIKNKDTDEIIDRVETSSDTEYHCASASKCKQVPVLRGGEKISVGVFSPGEVIYGTYETIPAAGGNPDEVYYTLIDSFVKSLEGENLGVTVSVHEIPSHMTKYILYVSGMMAGIQATGASYGDPVNVSTGAFTQEVNVLSVTGAGTLSMDLAYDSHLADVKGETGYGFSHTYEQKIEDKGATINLYMTPAAPLQFVSDEYMNSTAYGYSLDGQIVLDDEAEYTGTFSPSSDNLMGWKLYKAEDKSGYTLTDKTGNVTEFDAEGRLLKITKPDGKSVSFTRTEDTLTVCEDVSKQKLIFTYNEAGLICAVSDNNGRACELEYDEAGNLISYRDPEGNKTRFYYDGAHHMLKVTDPRGITMAENTYDDKGRVLTQKEAGSDKTSSFGYEETEKGGLITTVTNRQENTLIYESDELGNLLKTTDPEGNITTWLYDRKGNLLDVTAPDGSRTSYEYDEDNNRTAVYDTAGNVTHIAYDDRGNVISVTNGDGDAAYYSYDSRNLLISKTEPSGSVTSYTYDKYGRTLTETTTGLGTKSYTYRHGRLKTTTDGNGNVSSTEYDDYGNVCTMKDALGNESYYVYDKNGNLTDAIDACGGKTGYTYDKAGNLLTRTDNAGTTTYTYDDANRVKTVTDAEGNTTTYTYDTEGNVTKIKYPDGTKETNKFDACGNLIKTTDREGLVHTYEYDEMEHMVSETHDGLTTRYEYYPNGHVYKKMQPDGQKFTYTYDSGWNVILITDGKKRTTAYEYDAEGNVTMERDALGNETHYQYAPNGQLVSVTDKNGNTTSYGYDANGNCISVTDAMGNVTLMQYNEVNCLTDVTAKTSQGDILLNSYTYDAAGRVLTTTDGEGNTTRVTYDTLGNVEYAYDGYGRLIRSNIYDGLNRIKVTKDALGEITQYTYNNAGNIKEIVEGAEGTDQKTYTYGYDTNTGRFLSVTDPKEQISSYTYDASGNIKTVTDPNEGVTTYKYDELNRIIREITPMEQLTEYKYNAEGLLAGKYTADTTTEYTYDEAGRITSMKDGLGTVNYTYDANGNVLTVSDGNGTITRTYDALNRVKTCTDYKGNTISYGYDELGNRISITYPGGETVRYTYYRNGNIKTVTDARGNVSYYKYDKNGNLSQLTRPDGSVETYSYNTAGLVTDQTDKTAAGETIHAYHYEYDKSGNIIKITGTETGDTDLLTDVSMEYDADNCLVTYNGETVTYDLRGNMTHGPLNGRMADYEYDCRNRLVKVTEEDGTVTEYEYDAENTRTAVIKDEIRTEYVVDKNTTYSRILTETNYKKTIFGYTDKISEKIYTYGAGLLSEQRTGEESTTLYYHYNHLGSTTEITDQNGAVIYRFAYGTYGELTAVKDKEGNSLIQAIDGKTIKECLNEAVKETGITFLYNGEYGVQTDTNGLYYMRARYYNTDIKRFINRDVVDGSITNGQSLNKYSYVQGNPVSLTDPFGLCPNGRHKPGQKQNGIFKTIWEDAQPILKDFLLDIIPVCGAVKQGKEAWDYLKEGDYFNAINSAVGALFNVGMTIALVAGAASLLGLAIAPTLLVVASVTTFAASCVALGLSFCNFLESAGSAIGEYRETGKLSGDTIKGLAINFGWMAVNTFFAKQSYGALKGAVGAQKAAAAERAAAKAASESGLNSNLLDELANSGVKYNPEDIVAITKTADGKLVWLENGTDTAGLNHIITEHADDFLNKGITQEQIPDYVMNALENGKIVGYQGRGTGRPIYEFTYNGEIHKVAITVGNNGFIVGANPK